jgi:long-subunit acyl-CoA synthetase (AMP-forming)
MLMREVLTALAGHAVSQPHRPAIIDRFGYLSYGDLYKAIRRTAAWAHSLPDTVGLLAPRDHRAIIWHLALAWAGRTIVPLPEFFSTAQLLHLLRDAMVETVVAAPEAMETARSICSSVVTPELSSALAVEPVEGTRCIIYTSGTTGRPKGVVLGERQLDASVHAMIEAVGATGDDRMLSVLPMALLLEQVAGMAAPLSVGASITLCPTPLVLPTVAETTVPTVTIVVPEMLAGWVAWLERNKKRAPASLRFVAVGGAPVPLPLAQRAWDVGVPVYEGYGLSECCSVVAVNRPGDRVAGTVGRPLAGVGVSIDNGEIVVSGPTVMDGYFGGVHSAGIFRTGDAGRFTAEGRLIVDGRIDDVIVTSTGRNIHPEWIESMILGDPRIDRCAVVDGGSHPRAVLIPSKGQLVGASQAESDALIAELCAEAPEYARPRAAVVMPEALLLQRGLITANGRLRRSAIATYLKEEL